MHRNYRHSANAITTHLQFSHGFQISSRITTWELHITGFYWPVQQHPSHVQFNHQMQWRNPCCLWSRGVFSAVTTKASLSGKLKEELEFSSWIEHSTCSSTMWRMKRWCMKGYGVGLYFCSWAQPFSSIERILMLKQTQDLIRAEPGRLAPHQRLTLQVFCRDGH